MFGASAGAQLAGMLATLGHGSLTKGSRIQVGDLVVGPDGLHARERHLQRGDGHDERARLPRCAPADPGCLATEAAASPITYVDKSDAPMLARELRRRSWCRSNQATRMADALRAAHGPAPADRVARDPPRRCVPARRVGRTPSPSWSATWASRSRPPRRPGDHYRHATSRRSALDRARGHVRRLARRPLRASPCARKSASAIDDAAMRGPNDGLGGAARGRSHARHA